MFRTLPVPVCCSWGRPSGMSSQVLRCTGAQLPFRLLPQYMQPDLPFMLAHCLQGGAIGISPQGQLNTEARLQVVDSLFLDNSAVNGAGVFVQR